MTMTTLNVTMSLQSEALPHEAVLWGLSMANLIKSTYCAPSNYGVLKTTWKLGWDKENWDKKMIYITWKRYKITTILGWDKPKRWWGTRRLQKERVGLIDWEWLKMRTSSSIYSPRGGFWTTLAIRPRGSCWASLAVRLRGGCWASFWLVIGTAHCLGHLRSIQLLFGTTLVCPNLNLAWVFPNYVSDWLLAGTN